MKKIAALLTALVLMLCLCACSRSTASAWQEAYDLGIRYLSEGNYREAIIAFNAAIEIDPRQAEIYAARGDAYLGSALFEDAIADYQKAILQENNIFAAIITAAIPPFLADSYQDILGQGGKAEYYLRLSDGYLAQGDLEAAIKALRDGYNVTHDPALQERITAIQHISVFQGGVFAWGDDYLNTPIPGAVVTLRDTEAGAVVLSYKTDAEGLYYGYAVEGEYEFFAHMEGYRSSLVYKTIGTDETVYVENLYLLPEGDGSTGAIRGTVYSAVTGEPIAGAEVWAVANWNQPDTATDRVFRAVSDWDGSYVIPDQEIGYYTVFASYEGYMTSSVNVVVSGRNNEANWDIMLSPYLEEGEELRIVLTWGRTPEDLDSHLIMDCQNWQEGFFDWNDTYFSSMTTYDAYGDLVAQLDVDNTSSYGPETITVYKMVGHSFIYVIHDYTNGGRPDSTALSESEARVVVYGTDRVLGIFYVPVNMRGDIWVVFSINSNGVLQGVGEVTHTD